MTMLKIKPVKRHGIDHVFAAAGYSAAGLVRLWQETAFRHETLAFAVILAGFAIIGAPAWAFVGAALLYLAAGAFEAVNTAIEEIADHATPEYSEMAKAAKDLGSFAVACALFANGVWIAFVLWFVFIR